MKADSPGGVLRQQRLVALEVHAIPAERVTDGAFWIMAMRGHVFAHATNGPEVLYEALLPALNDTPLAANGAALLNGKESDAAAWISESAVRRDSSLVACLCAALRVLWSNTGLDAGNARALASIGIPLALGKMAVEDAIFWTLGGAGVAPVGVQLMFRAVDLRLIEAAKRTLAARTAEELERRDALVEQEMVLDVKVRSSFILFASPCSFVFSSSFCLLFYSRRAADARRPHRSRGGAEERRGWRARDAARMGRVHAPRGSGEERSGRGDAPPLGAHALRLLGRPACRQPDAAAHHVAS